MTAERMLPQRLWRSRIVGVQISDAGIDRAEYRALLGASLRTGISIERLLPGNLIPEGRAVAKPAQIRIEWRNSAEFRLNLELNGRVLTNQLGLAGSDEGHFRIWVDGGGTQFNDLRVWGGLAPEEKETVVSGTDAVVVSGSRIDRRTETVVFIDGGLSLSARYDTQVREEVLKVAHAPVEAASPARELLALQRGATASAPSLEHKPVVLQPVRWAGHLPAW